jgi:serine/threonine protein kinase
MACSNCAHLLDVSSLPPFTEIACPECQTPQAVPTRLGPFLLVELLGKGGMGAVYRGRDTSLDRWVAIKVMLATLGENQDFVSTFRREAQAAAALNHPNIVQIYSFGVAHGQPYMVMELLEGGRLDQMIAKGELLNESLVMKIAADVAEGLNTAAAIGLIHGDVKPENILLDNNGIAKIVDFGLARFKQNKEPSVKGIWGTPYYIAPEKIRGQAGDARSDIYSLGGTIFHALALKPPFEGETPIDVVKARLGQPAPLLHTLRPNVTPEVEAIVARMLEADPMRRYPTYVSLLGDIRNVQSSLKPFLPGSFGPAAKRGGKIVLTKKKAGGSIMAATSIPPPPIAIRVGKTDHSTSPVMTSFSEEKPPMERGLKIRLIVLGGILASLLAAGGITWGILHHNKVKMESLATAKENARLQKARGVIDAILNDLVSLTSNATDRCQTAQSWTTDLNLTASFIISTTNKLTDPALISEAETKTPVLIQIVSQAVTGTLHGFLVELQFITEAMSTNRIAMLAGTNAAQAEQTLLTLTNIPNQALTIAQSLKTEADRVESAYKDLLALKKRVTEAAAQQEAAAEQEAKERAEREAKERAEAAAQREADEKENQARAEMKLVQDLRKSNSSLIQQNQFKQAEESLTVIEKGLKSDAAKAEWKLTCERYRMLIGLKAFIIEAVNAESKENPETGYKFGWLNSKDILAADEGKITVRGGAFPWEQVPPSQMVRFIRHYAAAPGLAKREAARQYLAAAIYVFEAGNGSESAQKLSAEFTGEAQRANPALESMIKIYFPDGAASP